MDLAGGKGGDIILPTTDGEQVYGKKTKEGQIQRGYLFK